MNTHRISLSFARSIPHNQSQERREKEKHRQLFWYRCFFGINDNNKSTVTQTPYPSRLSIQSWRIDWSIDFCSWEEEEEGGEETKMVSCVGMSYGRFVRCSFLWFVFLFVDDSRVLMTARRSIHSKRNETWISSQGFAFISEEEPSSTPQRSEACPFGPSSPWTTSWTASSACWRWTGCCEWRRSWCCWCSCSSSAPCAASLPAPSASSRRGTRVERPEMPRCPTSWKCLEVDFGFVDGFGGEGGGCRVQMREVGLSSSLERLHGVRLFASDCGDWCLSQLIDGSETESPSSRLHLVYIDTPVYTWCSVWQWQNCSRPTLV